MNDKEQIEEMAKIAELELMIHFGGGDIVEPEDRPIQAESIAEAFYDAGYGDTKQAVKEFAEKLKEKMFRYYMYAITTADDLIHEIDELVKEVYGD